MDNNSCQHAIRESVGCVSLAWNSSPPGAIRNGTVGEFVLPHGLTGPIDFADDKRAAAGYERVPVAESLHTAGSAHWRGPRLLPVAIAFDDGITLSEEKIARLKLFDPAEGMVVSGGELKRLDFLTFLSMSDARALTSEQDDFPIPQFRRRNNVVQIALVRIQLISLAVPLDDLIATDDERISVGQSLHPDGHRHLLGPDDRAAKIALADLMGVLLGNQHTILADDDGVHRHVEPVNSPECLLGGVDFHDPADDRPR